MIDALKEFWQMAGFNIRHFTDGKRKLLVVEAKDQPPLIVMSGREVTWPVLYRHLLEVTATFCTGFGKGNVNIKA